MLSQRAGLLPSAVSCTPTPDAQLPVSGLLLAGLLASGLTHPVILSGFGPHPSQAQPRLAADSPVLLLFKRAVRCKPTSTEAALVSSPSLAALHRGHGSSSQGR